MTVHTQDDSYQSHQSDLDQSKTKDTSFSTSNNHGSMNKRLFWSILNFLHQHFSLKSTQFWYYKFFVWKHFRLSIYPLQVFFQGLSFFNIDFILPHSILITWSNHKKRIGILTNFQSFFCRGGFDFSKLNFCKIAGKFQIVNLTVMYVCTRSWQEESFLFLS